VADGAVADGAVADSAVAGTDAGDLVLAAVRGDKASWDALVQRYSGLVWSVTRGYRLGPADAADVFQTTWLRLAEHLGRIDKPGHVGAWLATTARHEALRIARGATRMVPSDEATLVALGQVDDYSPEQAALDAEQVRLNSERSARLWHAFGELPARCRELLRILIASPPPSYAEVAAAVGMPVGSIGPTRARCLRRLRERLAGEVSDDAAVAHEIE
jgi:RNA polymerase sigma factor (sigma-70 family)